MRHADNKTVIAVVAEDTILPMKDLDSEVLMITEGRIEYALAKLSTRLFIVLPIPERIEGAELGWSVLAESLHVLLGCKDNASRLNDLYRAARRNIPTSKAIH